MSIPRSNGPLVDLQPTYGAVFIGVLFSTGLLGVAISQVWRYYNNFPKDPVYLKLIVAYVIIVESIRLGFSVHGVYYYLVLEWGNLAALASLIWTSEVTLLLSPLVEIAVRLYFTYRVWIISRHKWFITLIIFVLAIANLAIGIGNWIITWRYTQVVGYLPLLHAFGTAGLALAVGADWSISLSLIYFLIRSRTGMSETNSVINHIVFYTINMGLITSMTDIVIIVLHLWTSRTPNIYDLAIYQVVGNLYANSLLASLNSRIGFRDSTTLNIPLSDFSTFAVSSRTQDVGSTISGSQHLRSGETVYFTKNLSTTQVEGI